MSERLVREHDMGFPVEEIVRGVEVVLGRMGAEPRTRQDGGFFQLDGPGGVTVQIAPMPEERITYPVLFPRTLLRLSGDRDALELVNRQILLYFLRVTG